MVPRSALDWHAHGQAHSTFQASLLARASTRETTLPSCEPPNPADRLRSTFVTLADFRRALPLLEEEAARAASRRSTPPGLALDFAVDLAVALVPGGDELRERIAPIRQR